MVIQHSYSSILGHIAKTGKGSLNADASQLIKDLLAKVMKPGYTRAPRFSKAGRGYTGRSGGGTQPPIKYAPKPRVEKDERQKNLDELRKLFNKLTGSKYEFQIPKLVQLMDDMEQAEGFSGPAVVDALFNVVESTPFYSRMYAKCYTVLCKDRPFLYKEIAQRRKRLTTSMESIATANPNEDYDAFCDLNKQNSRRQAIAKFLIALSEEGTTSDDEAIGLIEETVSLFVTISGQEGKKDEAGTLADLLGAMVIDNVYVARLLSSSATCAERIHEIATWKASSRPSTTNKAVFKFMDIRDYLRTYDE